MTENVDTWAFYEGKYNPNSPWLLHPCDVWVANPHYEGKPVGHPENDCDDVCELPEKGQPWTSLTFKAVADAGTDTGTWDDELPF